MKKLFSARDLALVIVGSFLFAASLNLFVVPFGLYNGGVVGISQLIRTMLTTYMGVSFSFDIAGIINLILNLPLFFIAIKYLNKKFFVGSVLSIVVQTLAFSFVVIPEVPIMDDVFASCAMGAVLSGVGSGLVLLSGSSAGGIDILGVFLSIKYKSFSVGKLGVGINSVIYGICAIVFDLRTALYSIIYSVIYSIAIDRTHLQNIDVSLMIFTKNKEVKKKILNDIVRGVTYWQGIGAYTDSETEVLVTIVSKYELVRVQKMIHDLDPKAFVIINEGLKISGGYEKRLL